MAEKPQTKSATSDSKEADETPRWKELLKLTGIPVVVASLCCLSPVIIVLLGLGTTAFAASLADTLYGDYKWVFRGVGLVALIVALVVYFRNKGICTLDQAKKHRREIINKTLLVLFVGVVGYIVFLYVVVEFFGIWLGIWENPLAN
jgi:hypothetical protein